MNDQFYSMVSEELEKAPARSAWARGVKEYARDLLADLHGSMTAPAALCDRRVFRRDVLNGARDWKEYSLGGCSLIYDADVAGRLCTPSELRRYNGGLKDPSTGETWLEVQARALYQAADVLYNAVFAAAALFPFRMWEEMCGDTEPARA